MPTRSVGFDYNDESVRLEYSPEAAAQDANSIAVLLEKSVFESLSKIYGWLVGCLVSWSISKAGFPVPITVEVIRDFPINLIAVMAQSVVDDLPAATQSPK
jgi:hypothetical protein